MQKITPFLWFDGKAEEAANFYISLFENSRIKKMDYWGEGTPFPKDQVKTCVFELAGQEFYAFDAGPQFKFNEAISFFVSAKTQDEIDHFWNKLTADGGSESMCGWLKDKFGISWQIVPPILMELMSSKDKVKAGKAMQAMMKMKKIIIDDLEKAVEE